MQQKFAVTGMTCAACSAHVEKVVSHLSGVESCGVNLMLGSMNVVYDPATVTTDDIIAAVVNGGYGARPANGELPVDPQQGARLHAMKRRLLWSLICLLPLFWMTMGHMLGLPLPDALLNRPLLHALWQMVFCIPVILLNRSYFTVGFSRLFQGSPNMDSLVAVGASAGLVYSICQLAMMDGSTLPTLYFESAGMILSLVTVGKYLEEQSCGKTTAAISALLALAPESAVVRRGGQELTIPAEQLTVGDTVIVRQGGRVAVDGIVTGGQGSVDESAITGESLPTEKQVGDTLTAATVLRSGYLEFRAERVGEDTTLAQIVRIMEQAATGKAPISRLADRIAGIFVPMVMSIALLSAVLWAIMGGQGSAFCLSAAIAVLVISCPCALGLATPVAITVGTGRAAEQGILIKSAEALELLGRVKTVALDKTGTVTEGRPRVTDILPCGDMTAEELLCVAASAEAPSEHPLSLAVVSTAKERCIPLCAVSDFTAVPGGIRAVLDTSTVFAGNRSLMEREQIAASPLAAQSEALAEEGKTPLFFAENGKLLGIIAVADTVRSDSAAAIAALKKSGCRVVLLTGDNERTARAIAAQVGIDEVCAQVLPQDKAACIKALQASHTLTAMVGDGINDAPALVQADVGLAIGAGTDIAIGSADMVLMHSSLQDIVAAVELSRAVLKNIRQKSVLGFFLQFHRDSDCRRRSIPRLRDHAESHNCRRMYVPEQLLRSDQCPAPAALEGCPPCYRCSKSTHKTTGGNRYDQNRYH